MITVKSPSSDVSLDCHETLEKAETVEVLRQIAAVLVLKQSRDAVKTPIITWSEHGTLYDVLAGHITGGKVCSERCFWRIARDLYHPRLSIWRPRMNGQQYIVLQGARLPESHLEWATVHKTLMQFAAWLKPETSVDALLQSLKELASSAWDLWECRTEIEGSATSGKRSAASLTPPPSKRPTTSGGECKLSPETDLSCNRMAMEDFLSSDLGSDMNGSATTHHMLRLPAVGLHAGVHDDMHIGEGDADVLLDMHTEEAFPQHYGFPAQDCGVPATLQMPRFGPRNSAVTLVNGKLCQTEVVVINVGGRVLQTELETLTCVHHTSLKQLAQAWHDFPDQQLFLDRSPQAFEDLLEQLRALRNGEVSSLHHFDAPRLAALQREAAYFCLPEIVSRVFYARMNPDVKDCQSCDNSSTVWQYDAVLKETGFSTKAEAKLQATMQSLTASVQARQADGWQVYCSSSDSKHRTDAHGREQKNISFQFLLRRRPVTELGAITARS